MTTIKYDPEDSTVRSVVRSIASKQGCNMDDLERVVNTRGKAPWRELHDARKSLRKLLNAVPDNLTDDADDNQVAKIEAAGTRVNELVFELTDEIDERGAEGVREWSEVRRDPRVPKGSDMVAGGGGEPRDAAESYALTPEQRFAQHPTVRGACEQEYSSLGLGTYLRSMVLGARGDTEKRALAEGTDSAGGYTVPTILSSQLVDLMRARNTAIMAGAQTIPLTSDRHHIAKVASDPSPSWRAENAAVAEDDPTFSLVEFTPKSLMVLVRVSRELLEDSLNIDTELPSILAASMAQELDRVVFLGSGTGSEPQGLDNVTDVQEVAHGSAAIADYTPFTQARRMLLNENVEAIGPWIMAPDLEEDIANLTDSTGQPLAYPPALDRPQPFSILTTSKLPTNLGTGANEGVIYGGDFRQVAIGMRSEVRVEVLRERYADSFQYGFMCHMRADVAAIHPKALVRITGVTT